MVSLQSPRFTLIHRLGLAALSVTAMLSTIAAPTAQSAAQAQAAGNQALTLRSDIQEANSVTGVITARGNVQINYPARQIQATAVQAQYYSRERRIVLSGDVYVLQNGNSLRGDTITYLVDQGRFVALPPNGQQVESIYLVQDPNPAATPGTATPAPSAANSSDPNPESTAPTSPP